MLNEKTGDFLLLRRGKTASDDKRQCRCICHRFSRFRLVAGGIGAVLQKSARASHVILPYSNYQAVVDKALIKIASDDAEQYNNDEDE